MIQPKQGTAIVPPDTGMDAVFNLVDETMDWIRMPLEIDA